MITGLFTAPLLIENLKLDNDKITNYCYNIEKKEIKNKVQSNRGGFQSWDLFDYEKIGEIEKLKINIENFANILMSKMEFDIDTKQKLISFWCNINRKKDYNLTHFHMRSTLAGTYYVKTPKNCGDIVFEHPSQVMEQTWNDCDWNTVNRIKYKKRNNINSKTFRVSPIAGQLLIFPSWLQHSVEPNLSNNDRISISFDTI